MTREELRDHINRFRMLPKNWGANPMTEATIQFALTMADHLPPGEWFVAPSARETICFWDGAKHLIEVFTDPRL